MKLKVINSNSQGNCYVITAPDGQKLILEAGCHIDKVNEAINFEFGSVQGCLLTHEHCDHAKYVRSIADKGVYVYMSKGTFLALEYHRQYLPLIINNTQHIGDFTAIPLEVEHDASQPVCWLIHHEQMGKLLFATDCMYLPYQVPNLDHLMIECNYCNDIIDSKTDKQFLVDRVRNSHMGLEAVLEYLDKINCKSLKTITLLHLSASNADENEMCKKIAQKTGIMPYIAKSGLEININKNPF